MKWLFTILVVLNIIVFGGALGSRMLQKQEADLVARRNAASAELARDVASPPQPLIKPVVEAASSATLVATASAPVSLDWIRDNGGAAEAPAEPKDTEEDAVRKIQERERFAQLQAERARKAREEQAKRDAAARNGATGNALSNNARTNDNSGGGRQCTGTASVSIPEDDYHRIKGLLGQWPHAASRRVERKEGGGKAKARGYAVWMPIQVDANAQMQSLNEKGFNTILMDGGISVGIRADKGQAQALLSKVQGAGFSAQLRELNSGGEPTGGQTVAKMHVTFMTVSDKDVGAIQAVVGKYGKLQRNNCR